MNAVQTPIGAFRGGVRIRVSGHAFVGPLIWTRAR